jgi:dTDP-4-dehydrorhamnose reductase
MANVVVLGSSGMLGSHVTRFLENQGHNIVEFNRTIKPISKTGKIFHFDATEGHVLEALANYKNFDYLINCIGVIRHKIRADNVDSVISCTLVNSIFPLELSKFAIISKCRVINIYTDCVFSGERGVYAESDTKDPTDLYGYTKMIGEQNSSRTMNIRSSFVGKELNSKFELLSWLINQPKNGKVSGYINHFWNGVTALHIAKIIDAVINKGLFKHGTFHLVPCDSVTKFNLISQIAKFASRGDILISPINSEKRINRTLTTNFPELNLAMWEAAGYRSVPTVDSLIKEYFDISS